MVIGEDDEDVGLGIRREERSAEEKGVKKSGDSHEADPDSVRGEDNFSESQIHKVLTLLLSLLIFFRNGDLSSVALETVARITEGTDDHDIGLDCRAAIYGYFSIIAARLKNNFPSLNPGKENP